MGNWKNHSEKKNDDVSSLPKIWEIKKMKRKKRNFNFEELTFFTRICNGLQTFTEYAQIRDKKEYFKTILDHNDIITKNWKYEFSGFVPSCFCKQQLELMKVHDLRLYQ